MDECLLRPKKLAVEDERRDSSPPPHRKKFPNPDPETPSIPDKN
jgi:hypothetical protein